MHIMKSGAVLLLLLLSFLSFTSALRYGSGRRTHRSGRVAAQPVTDPVVHAEGPHWDHERGLLYFVDISSSLVMVLNDSNGDITSIPVPGGQPVSIAIPVQGSETDLLVTRGRDVVLLDEDTCNVTRVLTSVDQDKPGNRFNDGKADPRGRLWAGTMGPEDKRYGVSPGQGSLYMMEDDLSMTTQVTGIDVSNGLAWNEDGSLMYYIDTGTGKIDVFDYDLDTGNISERRTVFDFAVHNMTGYPDSMSIDTEGNLWVACWAGSQVIQIDPVRGELLKRIQFPVRDITSVAWGGRNLDELFVTTSRRDLTEEELIEQPLAGCVFKVTGLGARGLPGQSVQLPLRD